MTSSEVIISRNLCPVYTMAQVQNTSRVSSSTKVPWTILSIKTKTPFRVHFLFLLGRISCKLSKWEPNDLCYNYLCLAQWTLLEGVIFYNQYLQCPILFICIVYGSRRTLAVLFFMGPLYPLCLVSCRSLVCACASSSLRSTECIRYNNNAYLVKLKYFWKLT